MGIMSDYVAKQLNIPRQATPVTGEVVPEPGKKRKVIHYEEKFAQDILDFFKAVPLFRTTIETITWKDGTTSEKEKEIGNPPPLFEEWAEEIGVSVKTLKKWASLYPDFAEAVMICEGIIKKFVITHGLGGSYNSQFAIFAAKNITDMKDKTINENRTVNVNELLDQIESSEKPLFEDPNN